MPTLSLLLSTGTGTRCIPYVPSYGAISYEDLYKHLKGCLHLGELPPSPRLRLNGRELRCGEDSFFPDITSDLVHLEITARLLGGKGGFGTLLRGKGARGPKTSNFESSRDLQGRRLRVARAPERMRQWVEKKVREHEVIKAVGGEDPFLGKSLSAEEVVRLYKLQVSNDSHNPFTMANEEADYQSSVRMQALEAAKESLISLDGVSSSPPAEQTEARLLNSHGHHLDSYLEDLEDVMQL